MEEKLKTLGLLELIEKFADAYEQMDKINQVKAETTLQTLVQYDIHPESAR